MAPPKEFRVGDTFTHQRTCDRYRPMYYAGASGDFNPIHIDPEAGKAAGLGSNILHGLCTMAWAVEAALGYVGDPGKIRRVRVRFSRPVLPEDTISITGKVSSIEGGKLTADLTAKNQRGEDVLRGAVVEAQLEGSR
jgi:acyl dehydratase